MEDTRQIECPWHKQLISGEQIFRVSYMRIYRLYTLEMKYVPRDSTVVRLYPYDTMQIRILTSTLESESVGTGLICHRYTYINEHEVAPHIALHASVDKDELYLPNGQFTDHVGVSVSID